jgi:GlpG protein
MQTPPLERWQRYPVTIGFAIGAAMMTAWTKFAEDAAHSAPWTMTDEFWMGQIWRPLSSCLLHGNILHLVFNLYWLWVFGAVIEEVFGSARMLLLVIFLAFGSSLAQYAFSGPGIGLSGVVYGLFGLLWALRRFDRRFIHALDDSTVHLLVGWFFLCIVATVANIMSVANVAHGSGAVLGAMLGYAIGEKNKHRKIGYASLIAVSMAVIFAAASVGREYVNFSGDVQVQKEIRAYHIAKKGIAAFEDRDYEKAAGLFSEALKLDDAEAGYWYNLGLCRLNLGDRKKALEAFRRAAELQPDNQKYKNTLELQLPID